MFFYFDSILFRDSIQDQKRRKTYAPILPNRIVNSNCHAKIFKSLLNYEKKLNNILNRKRLYYQEALKTPLLIKRMLRVNILNQFYPLGEEDRQNGRIPFWKLRIEGRLLEDAKSKSKSVCGRKKVLKYLL